MTTISDLSEEILLLIFNYLYNWDALNCQRVCRSWYRPAHLTFLHEITFCDDHESIELFIESINSNPDPSYLKAVKVLRFSEMTEADYHFDKETIRKLFMRFPNLEKVHVNNLYCLFEEFDQQLCDELLRSCPKMKTFSVFNEPEYIDAVYKIRPILTHISASTIDSSIPRFGNIVEFITSIPRLRKIREYTIHLNSFLIYLEIFEQLQNLTTITVYETGVVPQVNFAERFFKSKPKNVQDLIVERLSRVRNLGWLNRSTLSLASLEFVRSYFTGLTELDIYSKFDNPWTVSEKQVFWTTLSDLIKHRTTCASIFLDLIRFIDSKVQLGDLVHKLFHQSSVPSTSISERSLKISLADDQEFDGFVDLFVFFRKRDPTITITVRNYLTLLEQTGFFLEREAPLDVVDVLVLGFKKRELARHNHYSLLLIYRFLSRSIRAKEIVLDIHEAHTDKDEYDQIPTAQYPHVETMTIQASRNADFQVLLDSFAHELPNLKHLKLHYYSGTWENSRNEFLVSLDEYALEKLTIDVTPVKHELLSKPLSMGQYTFVIVLEQSSSSSCRFFKVSFDGNTLSTTPTTYYDIRGFKLGEDCICVHVMIKSLKSFGIYMFRSGIPAEETYLQETLYLNLESATLF